MFGFYACDEVVEDGFGVAGLDFVVPSFVAVSYEVGVCFVCFWADVDDDLHQFVYGCVEEGVHCFVFEMPDSLGLFGGCDVSGCVLSVWVLHGDSAACEGACVALGLVLFGEYVFEFFVYHVFGSRWLVVE